MLQRGLVFKNIYKHNHHIKIFNADSRLFLFRFKSVSSTFKSRVKRVVRDLDDTASPSSFVMEEKYKKDFACEKSRLSDLKVKALSFLPSVDETVLDEQKGQIHNAHVQALKHGEMFYKDPVTGYSVMTRLAHLSRGECCGNACRHCPFGQTACPQELRRKFNSAFYE